MRQLLSISTLCNILAASLTKLQITPDVLKDVTSTINVLVGIFGMMVIYLFKDHIKYSISLSNKSEASEKDDELIDKIAQKVVEKLQKNDNE